MKKAWEKHWPYEKSIMKKIKGLKKIKLAMRKAWVKTLDI